MSEPRRPTKRSQRSSSERHHGVTSDTTAATTSGEVDRIEFDFQQGEAEVARRGERIEPPSPRCGKTDFSIDGLLSSCGPGAGSTSSSNNISTATVVGPEVTVPDMSQTCLVRMPHSPGHVTSACDRRLGEVANFEWLHCSRYKPPKLPRRRELPRRRYLGRNPRIPFTAGQVSALEAQFAAARYLSGTQVHSIAKELGLTETRVKIWFQNRRAREKRERPPRDSDHDSAMTAASSALRATLASETMRCLPALGLGNGSDSLLPLQQHVQSPPPIYSPRGLGPASAPSIALNGSNATGFLPPFPYWPPLPPPQWSRNAGDELP
ncbi:uncharacterized protein LOC144134520 [Amblyomma americanum]